MLEQTEAAELETGSTRITGTDVSTGIAGTDVSTRITGTGVSTRIAGVFPDRIANGRAASDNRFTRRTSDNGRTALQKALEAGEQIARFGTASIASITRTDRIARSALSGHLGRHRKSKCESDDHHFDFHWVFSPFCTFEPIFRVPVVNQPF